MVELAHGGTGEMLHKVIERQFSGLHVLVAEDDYIQCDWIVACLSDLGASVVGPAHCALQAHELLASERVQFAIVDLDLGDGVSFELAGGLHSRQVPFIFATGYDCLEIPAEFAHIRCLLKPFTERALADLLTSAVSDTCH